MKKYYKPKTKNVKALKQYLNADQDDNKRRNRSTSSKRNNTKRNNVQ